MKGKNVEVTCKTIGELTHVIREYTTGKKVYIFGAGEYGKIIANYLISEEVRWDGFIDNDRKKAGKKLYGKTISPLEEIEGFKNAVIILSLSPVAHKVSYDELCKQLIAMGFGEEQLIRLSENLGMMEELLTYVKKPEKYFERLKNLKGKYKNKRAFIIGNGPSLNIQDLEKLESEITFGCNAIIQVFEKTKWRPTCFFVGDAVFTAMHLNTREKVEKITNECEILLTSTTSNVYDEYRDEFENIYFFYTKRDLDNIRFEEDITKGICAGGTSLYSILQVAVYMGIKEIYLLGVDFSFRKEVHADGSIVLNEKVQDHMKEMEQLDQSVYYVDMIMQGWLTAKAYAEKHGIRIYNATRGGKLEVFERVEFDSLF